MKEEIVIPRFPDTRQGALECLREISEFAVPDNALVIPDSSRRWCWMVEFSHKVRESRRSKRMVTEHVRAVVYIDQEDFEAEVLEMLDCKEEKVNEI